jgi:hypothetical protein
MIFGIAFGDPKMETGELSGSSAMIVVDWDSKDDASQGSST